ncbi:MAG: hypothetical protein L6R38_003443 [Xanthoria sp. 2 TBL-2021]|nr:MAG: hypothetical protein L6R38_003443 [Xanthoria sp. 2 TBL-2021]
MHEEMNQGPPFRGNDLSIGSSGYINNTLNAVPGHPFTTFHQGRKRHAPNEYVSEDHGAKRPRGQSPQHTTDGRANETPLERAEAGAHALNGKYHPKDIAKPEQSGEENARQPDVAEQTATADNTMGFRAPNEIWITIPLHELPKFLEFETSQAQQKIMEVGFGIVILHQGCALDFERRIMDVDRRTMDLERRTIEFEQLHAKIQQAAAVEIESAGSALKSEQRGCQPDCPARNTHLDYFSLPSRTQHEEARVEERNREIKIEEGSIGPEYATYASPAYDVFE